MLRSETQGQPERLRNALEGLKTYQQAERPIRGQSGTIAASAGRATLRDFGGTGRPVIFVPSLINGSEILDLAPHNSLMQWLADEGLRPLLLDWGTPEPDERDLTIGGHVETLLLPLIDAVGPDTAIAGYCLGGTMALAAAALRPVSGVALIAAPWDFSGFPADSRTNLGELWEKARPTSEGLGLLPLEVLQQAFWGLDPARTVEKFVRFGRLDPDAALEGDFIAVEDWANAGAPLTMAAARELMETLMAGNASGEGRWEVGGRMIRAETLQMPILNVASTTDRITPAATAWRGGTRIELVEGHVGMIVGRRAKASLWPRLRDWLSQLRNS
ncbi:alpha/beta hydrolase [Sphingomonas montanisoli]|uniref:Alpha/beta hydrolase n=2 Tax=Sphingomonas montanisoli TaxID=2606412 RepID=A0A5D9CF87_9SPHN|nr:alpha/beta hydrolase [Sphingomonas montanisoli]